MRVIRDAFRTNRRFRPTPPVSLVTAKGFANISVEGGGPGDLGAEGVAGFALASAEVQNCF